uniref:Solute carrier family 26 member 10 n=1 Tax=Pan troglodytes TaxID=9598 RepID=A0A2I3RGQ7_PANTR
MRLDLASLMSAPKSLGSAFKSWRLDKAPSPQHTFPSTSIPGMAFALLASLPPVFRLYTSFFPVLIYSLLGTGRHLSTGTFAILSLMTGSVARRNPEGAAGRLRGVDGERGPGEEPGGIPGGGARGWFLGMFVLQLGVLSTFLSEPVVKALTSGAALHVLLSQLPSLLGLSLSRQIGCFSLFKTLASLLTALPWSSPAELTISVLSLALLVPVKELNVRFRDRLATHVLLASVLCFTSSVDTRYQVQIVGLLPGGFPQPLLPNLAELPRILADSLPIALVTFAVSASLASIYADKYSYTIDSNQELLSHGASNLISSLFSCFSNSATLATTNLLVDAGGKTQLAGLFSCTVVLSVLLWLGPFFYYLPKAVLACINISSMRQVFCQMQELPQLWHISRVDFLLQVPGLCILSYPTPLYFGTHGQFRRNLEWHLGLGEGEKETSKPDGPMVAVAEPVRVVVLDFSGVTFADAAGAREVVQVRERLASRCRDARIRLLLAQCNALVQGTLTRAGLLDRVTPDQLFVSVQDAAAYALGSLVRGSSTRSGSWEALGCGK